MATNLKIGASGPEVKKLQQALNKKLIPNPGLVPDGQFGNLTAQAVRKFQAANWLVVDGEAGPCTQAAALDTEGYAPILHRVPFIPQKTNSTCWAASTAMVNRSSEAAVIALTPPELISPSGGLRNFSGSNDPMTGSGRFAAAHHLNVVAPTSWPPSVLKAMLARGPLIFDMLWESGKYAAGQGSPGHMIVVVGIRGDNDQSGRGTTLRIQDPWAPNVGDRYSVGYFKWIQEVPTRTYHIYHKR